MICIIALVVFGILGIFSAKYRVLAKEAFDCVLRRVTFRKCSTALNERLRSQISGKIMRKSLKAGGFVYKNFELLSWVFTVLLLVSLVYSAYSGYNYAKYGNCNGKSNGEGFCIFDPTGKGKFSTFASNYSGEMIFPTAGDDPGLGSPNATVTMIEFGCFMCPYTKKAEPAVKQIVQEYGDRIYYVYKDFPLNERHLNADLHSEAADCALEQGKYWEYHDILFEHQQNMSNHTLSDLVELAGLLSLDQTQFRACLESEKYKDEVYHDFEEGVKASVYGTPTFFINKRILVGPRSYDELKNAIEEELAK